MTRQRRRSSEQLVATMNGQGVSVNLSDGNLEDESSTDPVQRTDSYMEAQRAVCRPLVGLG